MVSRIAVLIAASITAAAASVAVPRSRAHSNAQSPPHAEQFLSVNTKTANPGTSIALDQCFVLGFAAESVVECGDLRVVHALPSTRVRGVTRTPTLLYNSQHAHPFPIVRANVAMPSGNVTGATATLQLIVNSVLTTVATQNYTGAQLPGDSTRRIALAFDGSAFSTGVYPYTLTVAVTVAGNPSAVTVQTTDTLVIVNRSTSEFGAGWWLAGYERLIELPTSALLWIGGDGSTRLYTHRDDGGSVSLTKWMTDSITRPDSIVRPSFTYTFTRYVPNGGRIVFDNTGQHTVTIDRLGDSTKFGRNGNGSLATITLPTLFSPYAFVYNSSQMLDRVVAPPFYLGAPDRATIATIVNGQTTALTDPDGSTTSFAYAGTVSNMMSASTDKMGAVRQFAYDGAQRLASTMVYADSQQTQLVRWSLCAAESRGFIGGGTCSGTTPPDTLSATTTVDGPRSVADIYIVWVTRLGAVRAIRNPSGNSTTFNRTDPRFEGLVTQAIDANGFVQLAAYNERGNLVHIADLNPLGDGVDTYTFYDHASLLWPDGVTRITRPMSSYQLFTYDADGNVLSRENGLGEVVRTVFAYGAPSSSAPKLLVSVTHPNVVTGRTDFDSLQYDGNGNVTDVLTATKSGSTIKVVAATHTANDPIGRPFQVCVDITIVASPPQQCTTTQLTPMGLDSIVTVSGAALNGVPAQSLISQKFYDREGRVLRAVRSSSPDPGNIGSIVTQWQYDLVGRRTLEVAPDGQMERTYYDLAGNVDSVRTRRGHVLRMTYGLENQLLTRAVPSAAYADTLAGIGAADGQPYPLRPNAGAAYVVAADTDVFTYDALGRMTSANNSDAHIARSYFRGGALRTEQQDVRDAVGTAFSHQYLLAFTYDRDGRRRAVKLPSQLVAAGTTDSIAEQYDGTTLELISVTDPLGHVYGYQYTNRSQPSVLTYPGNYQRRWTYNTADRDSTDAVVNIGGTTGGRVPLITLRSSTFTNDARGNRLTTDDAFGLQERQRFAYAGLGHVVMSNLRQFGRVNYPSGNAPVVALTGEAMSYDAFGNVLTVTTGDTLRANSATGSIMSASKTAFASTYQTAVGRLVSQNSGAKTFRYDAAGNLNFVTLSASGSAFHDDRFAYYAADGRLRASDYRSQTGGTNVYAKWVFETYRYDALGRRVWVRTDRKCTLPVPGAYDAEWLECDLSTVRRTVWDGARELIELQMPVKQAGTTIEEATSTLENDLYVPTLPRAQGNDQNPFFGRVVYTHGLTTDEPIGLTRYNYVDWFNVSPTVVAFPPTGISLVWNALGKMSLAICGDGQQECTFTANGRNANMWFGVPAGWFVYERPTFVLNAFQGTLARDKQDATRTLYRRNRYYDPASGRFTQEDPIGLAGGSNLYGFAGSDPVNFSDPFGLCPESMGGDGKTKTEADCPEGSVGRNHYRSGAVVGGQFSPLDILEFVLTAGVGGGTGAAAAGIDATALTVTKTVAKNAASRPFQNSSLLMQEIMRSGKAIADPGGIAGGLRWDVPGYFGKSKGVWELVVDPKNNEIVHFLFKSQK